MCACVHVFELHGDCPISRRLRRLLLRFGGGTRKKVAPLLTFCRDKLPRQRLVRSRAERSRENKLSFARRVLMPPPRLQVLLGVVEALRMDQALIFCR